MKRVIRAASWVSLLLVLTGCASTQVTELLPYTGEKLARPDRIIVYDFAAIPGGVSAQSASAGQYAEPSTPLTTEEIEIDRKLGVEIAKNLVAQIQDMGLPAVQAAGQPAPRVNDIVIKGYLLSVEEGSAGQRLLVGFRSGEAKLKTTVESYQMTTAQVLRLLASYQLDSAGSKTPGVLVPLAMLAATANPISLIGMAVAGTTKMYGENTGSNTIDGASKQTADAIATELRSSFEKQGWIEPNEKQTVWNSEQ
jgi:uncharacterized protein DUF4410